MRTAEGMMTERKSQWAALFLAAIAAFSTYFCMYAFRKPFSAATFEGMQLFGIDYKIVLIIAQVLGYASSKFWGIRFVSSLKTGQRARAILGLLGLAWLSLLLLAIIPVPYNVWCLFLNGLPLGLIWGIVFSYLEGRQSTEILGAVLAASFIISSGVVKAIGKYLLDHWGLSDFWMPFCTAALFVLPLLLSVYLLDQTPAPSAEDQALRHPRQPMTKQERRVLFKKYQFGLVAFIIFYTMITVLRDFRDNFMVEIWSALGFKNAAVLATAELPIAFGVLLIISGLVWVRNNRTALQLNHAFLVFSSLFLLTCNLLWQQELLSAKAWMIGIGFGVFLSYLLFHSIIFERLLAVFREPGNVGFLMYLSDSFGYLGSVAVLLFKNFAATKISWVSFFTTLVYGTGALGLLLAIASWWYFHQKLYSSHATKNL
jgi:MFS family permease